MASGEANDCDVNEVLGQAWDKFFQESYEPVNQASNQSINQSSASAKDARIRQSILYLD
jgi:hypothetical protein